MSHKPCFEGFTTKHVVFSNVKSYSAVQTFHPPKLFPEVSDLHSHAIHTLFPSLSLHLLKSLTDSVLQFSTIELFFEFEGSKTTTTQLDPLLLALLDQLPESFP